MFKKLHISVIYSNLVLTKNIKFKSPYAQLVRKFRQNFDICKSFSTNLVNELGNMPRPGVVPKFSDLEVIALNLTAESMCDKRTVPLSHMNDQEI